MPLADLAAAALGAARLFVLHSFKPESIVTVVFQAHAISAEAVHGQTPLWYSRSQRVIRSAADGRWEGIPTEPFESGQALRSSATVAYGRVPDEFRSWDHFAALARAAVSCATRVRDGIGYRHKVCHRGQLIDVSWNNPAKQDHPVQCQLIDVYGRVMEQVEH